MSASILIVDEDDRPVGSATKQEAWERGQIHEVVRIMVFNAAGMVLLQHRAPIKDIFPNCWDSAAAGHVDAGEDYEVAVKREIEEELGWSGVRLSPLGKYYTCEVWKGHKFNRFSQCYTATSEEMPTKMEEGKIDGWRWWSLDEVKNLVKNHPDQVTDGLRQIIEKYY